MEVRLRRSTLGGSGGGGGGGGGGLTSDEAEAGACWLDQSKGEEGGQPGEEAARRGLMLQHEELRRRRASQASALLAHQNLLMSPGAADRVFGYRSGSGVEEDEEDQGARGGSRNISSGTGGGARGAAASSSSSSSPPSAADILRGPMRFGASVVEQRASTIPSSPSDRDRSVSMSMSGSASKRWPKQQQPQQEQRRRSSLSESAHRIVCGLRLANGDVGSIALLLVLYTLQGIPMGLSASVPFLLQERVSYKQQALFSLVSLPFSFKLLWAPIVDSTRFLGLGRRKVRLRPPARPPV